MGSGTLSDGLFFFESGFGKTVTDTVMRNIIRLLFLNGFLPGLPGAIVHIPGSHDFLLLCLKLPDCAWLEVVFSPKRMQI